MKLAPGLSLTLALLVIGSAHAAPPTASFTIAISTPHSIVKVGEAAPINIVMTNISNQDISYPIPFIAEPNSSSIFRIHILAEDNKDVPETPFGQKQHPTGPVGGSAFNLRLAPGESAKFHDLVLNKQWEINQPGKYTVYAERFDPQSSMTVKSNVIVLTVQ
jgi:hypothetical protein